MDTSLFIARLIGPLLLVAGAATLINQENTLDRRGSVLVSEGGQFLLSLDRFRMRAAGVCLLVLPCPDFHAIRRDSASLRVVLCCLVLKSSLANG